MTHGRLAVTPRAGESGPSRPGIPVLACLFLVAVVAQWERGLPLGLSHFEIDWIAAAQSPLARIGAAWVGFTGTHLAMRLPVALLAAAAAPVAAVLVFRMRGAGPAIAAGLGVALLPLVASASLTIGPGPFVIAGCVVSLAVAAMGTGPSLGLLALLGILGFALEPILTLGPSSAFLGVVLTRVTTSRPGILVALVLLLAGVAGAAHKKDALVLPSAGETSAAAIIDDDGPHVAPQDADAAPNGIREPAKPLDAAEPGELWWASRGYFLVAAFLAAAGVLSRGSMTHREDPADPVSRQTSAAITMTVVALVWLVDGTLRHLTTAPALGLAVALPVAVAGMTRSRASSALLFMLLPAASGFAWMAAIRDPPTASPVAQAIASLRNADRGLSRIVAGPGLSDAILRHSVRASGLADGMSVGPEADRRSDAPAETNSLGVLSRVLRPTMEQRESLGRAIGARFRKAYGEETEGGDTIGWSLAVPLTVRPVPGAERPNIAIVSVDTLRADHLPFHGYGRDTAPALSEWARGAVIYENAVAPAPLTAPSFASLLTGRFPFQHGLRSNYDVLDPGNWTLARILNSVGYDTAAFVSSYVLTDENCGFSPGFDRYDQQFDDVERNRADLPLRLAPSLASAARQWIDDPKRAAKPWFLWVHAIDPHGPYTPLAGFKGSFTTGGSGKVAQADPGRFTPPELVPRDAIPEYQWLGTLRYADYRDAYDDEILQTDRSLGAIIAGIRRTAGARTTIIVFVADHGEAFGEHGVYFQHGHSLHAEELHVPLVIEVIPANGVPSIKLPQGETRGRVESHSVSTVDVAPTLLSMAGIMTNLPMEGVTLDLRVREGTPVLSGWRPGEIAARSGSLKVIIGDRSMGAPGMCDEYDLSSDPEERNPRHRGAQAAASASGSHAGGSLAGAVDPGFARLEAAGRAALLTDPLAARALVSGGANDRAFRELTPDEVRRLKSLGYVEQ